MRSILPLSRGELAPLHSIGALSKSNGGSSLACSEKGMKVEMRRADQTTRPEQRETVGLPESADNNLSNKESSLPSAESNMHMLELPSDQKVAGLQPEELTERSPAAKDGVPFESDPSSETESLECESLSNGSETDQASDLQSDLQVDDLVEALLRLYDLK